MGEKNSKAQKINVIIKEPHKNPYRKKIPHTLKAFQSAVGGYIETFTFAPNMVAICNEDGRQYGLEPNCSICGVSFVGTVIIAGIDKDDFADIPIGLKPFRRLFPQLFWEKK